MFTPFQPDRMKNRLPPKKNLQDAEIVTKSNIRSFYIIYRPIQL